SRKSSGGEAAALRKERDDLQARLDAELQAAADSQRRADDAESALSQHANELERARTELHQLRAKFDQSESNWRKQLDAAQSKRADSGKAAAEASTALRRERDELHARLAAEHQSAAESASRASEAESRLSENEAELERVKVELHQSRAKFDQSESN